MSGVWVSGRYLVVVRPKSLIGAKTRRLELHRLWRAFGSHGVVTIQHRCDTGTIGELPPDFLDTDLSNRRHS